MMAIKWTHSPVRNPGWICDPETYDRTHGRRGLVPCGAAEDEGCGQEARHRATIDVGVMVDVYLCDEHYQVLERGRAREIGEQ